jgi:hypothetical protein
MSIHTHCWHSTDKLLCSMPPQRVAICCFCKETRNLVIKLPADNFEEHGKFHPNTTIKESE